MSTPALAPCTRLHLHLHLRRRPPRPPQVIAAAPLCVCVCVFGGEPFLFCSSCKRGGRFEDGELSLTSTFVSLVAPAPRPHLIPVSHVKPSPHARAFHPVDIPVQAPYRVAEGNPGVAPSVLLVHSLRRLARDPLAALRTAAIVCLCYWFVRLHVPISVGIGFPVKFFFCSFDCFDLKQLLGDNPTVL